MNIQDYITLGGRFVENRPVAAKYQVPVPPPILLPFRWSEEKCAQFLVNTFYTEIVGVEKRVQVERMKHYKTLAWAAHFMRSNNIRPVQWLRFSHSVWHQKVHRTKPTIAFCFSKRRLSERQAWFNFMKEDTLMSVVSPRAYTRWVAAWDDMAEELVRSSPRTRDAVISIFDKHFPGDTWEHMEAAADVGLRDLDKIVHRQTFAGIT